jgi:hypothetical protein
MRVKLLVDDKQTYCHSILGSSPQTNHASPFICKKQGRFSMNLRKIAG